MQLNPISYLRECRDFPILRRLPPAEGENKRVYLSFDDGPQQKTADILKLLADYQAKASFFLIADLAKQSPDLVEKINQEGHAIGNHSLDHKYRHFFHNKRDMILWVARAEDIFKEELKIKTIGFRSPAGILTPELFWALKGLNLPLIHWDVRYYDGVFSLSASKVEASMQRIQDGSIILLHERSHLASIERLLQLCKSAGFELCALPAKKKLQELAVRT